uniref:SCAN box domain-containing protein n=1 Tax=Chelydra serpentina TaxID=8475 RepID=A0A8C3XPZ3_CHESE
QGAGTRAGNRLGLSAERYQQRFRAARWIEGVRPRAFAQRLTDWATRWLRPTAQTMEEVMDQIILEQFLLGLPDPVMVWVRRHQPAQVAEAVRLTEEYVEAEGPRRGMKPSKGAGSGRSPPDSLPKKGTDPGPTHSRELTCWQCGLFPSPRGSSSRLLSVLPAKGVTSQPPSWLVLQPQVKSPFPNAMPQVPGNLPHKPPRLNPPHSLLHHNVQKQFLLPWYSHLTQAWTEWEELDLIAVWGNESVLSERRSKRRNAKIFGKISNAMMDRGYSRDATQCRMKIKELRQAYQKTKESNGSACHSSGARQEKPWENLNSFSCLGSLNLISCLDIVASSAALATMQSSPAEVTMQSQNRRRASAWTDQEVLDLIAVWGDESVLSELRSKRRNAKIYEKISKAMTDRGYSQDATQCRVKIKELRQAYQKTKESNGRSGSQPQTCRFYEALHSRNPPGTSPRSSPGGNVKAFASGSSGERPYRLLHGRKLFRARLAAGTPVSLPGKAGRHTAPVFDGIHAACGLSLSP